MTLPLQPLLDLLRLDEDRWAAQLSERVGVTRRTCDRWAVSGLTPTTADRVAVALDLHPLVIWPEWGQADNVVPFQWGEGKRLRMDLALAYADIDTYRLVLGMLLDGVPGAEQDARALLAEDAEAMAS